MLLPAPPFAEAEHHPKCSATGQQTDEKCSLSAVGARFICGQKPQLNLKSEHDHLSLSIKGKTNMSTSPHTAQLKEGGATSVSNTLGQVDPMSIRSKLMLESVSHMMTEADWPYRAATIDLHSQGDEIGNYRLFGANHPDSIQDVYERKLDISIMNPGVILSMAHQGRGLFSHPMEVALIAVLPHYDQLGFAVTPKTGLTSLTDIREKRYPLRLSVRGSLDACTTRLFEHILKVHGFSYADIESWGGKVTFDQPMPRDTSPGVPSRLERVKSGDLDAIFEEGVIVWANDAAELGMNFLELDEQHLVKLEGEGFKRAFLEKQRLPSIPRDIATVDFSGWPVYCRKDTSHLLVRKFCEAVEARKDCIPWTWGPVKQKPMPLEKMVNHSPETPIDLPFHPAAEEFWRSMGYLS
jgi:TRAP-type uncharacterized transport system substrate-binding protein